MATLIYHKSPEVTIATNTFINVPVILKVDDINLIEIIRDTSLRYTTQIPIYHPDGTYLAKVVGTRIYATEDGKKANLVIDKYREATVCKLDREIAFEIKHQPGDAFKAYANLYTPKGYFVKCDNSALPGLSDTNGSGIQINGLSMSGNIIADVKIAIWVRSDGSFSLGVK